MRKRKARKVREFTEQVEGEETEFHLLLTEWDRRIMYRTRNKRMTRFFPAHPIYPLGEFYYPAKKLGEKYRHRQLARKRR